MLEWTNTNNKVDISSCRIYYDRPVYRQRIAADFYVLRYLKAEIYHVGVVVVHALMWCSAYKVAYGLSAAKRVLVASLEVG